MTPPETNLQLSPAQDGTLDALWRAHRTSAFVHGAWLSLGGAAALSLLVARTAPQLAAALVLAFGAFLLLRSLRREISGALVVLVAVMGGLAVSELAFRLRHFGPAGLIQFSHYQPVSSFMVGGLYDPVADPEVGFLLRPDGATWLKGTFLEVNELGFRGSETPSPTKRTGVLRVLAFGASTTMGSGVDMEHVYAHRLEPLLSEATGREVEVLNFGIAGMGISRWSGSPRSKPHAGMQTSRWLRFSPGAPATGYFPDGRIGGRFSPVRNEARRSWERSDATASWPTSSIASGAQPTVLRMGSSNACREPQWRIFLKRRLPS